MANIEITDPLFRQAVHAIGDGQIDVLRELLHSRPALIAQRADHPKEGYFQFPYLLWFVADNPIQNGKLPTNIVDITRLLIEFAKVHAKESFEHQVNYACGLVETGRIPRECGVQIALIDLFLENGVKPGDGHGALANGNIGAAKHIVKKSGKITLTAAISFDQMDDVKRLLSSSSEDEKQVALIAASFFGKADMISLLLASGADVNRYIKGGFHSHASALHQAVYSGSLDAVKTLVNAGASLSAVDKVYQGTPLGWARYMQTEESTQEMLIRYKEIEDYLSMQPN